MIHIALHRNGPAHARRSIIIQASGDELPLERHVYAQDDAQGRPGQHEQQSNHARLGLGQVDVADAQVLAEHGMGQRLPWSVPVQRG